MSEEPKKYCAPETGKCDPSLEPQVPDPNTDLENPEELETPPNYDAVAEITGVINNLEAGDQTSQVILAIGKLRGAILKLQG